MKEVIKDFLSNKKILPSLLVLFLIIGIGATIIAVQRSTEFRQQASTVQNENPYQVVPVIYLSSDFNSDITNYTKQVRDNFLEVAQWYKQKIDKTFNVAEPVVFKDTLTFSQILSKYPDASVGSTNGYFVKYEMPKALSSNGMDICDSTKIYYFVTPMNVNWGGSGGREFFGCERFPGYASIPGHMGRLIGGIIDPNWPEWWAVEPRQARGGVAHELTHLFGAYCDTTGCNLTPHNQDPNSVMNAWWDYEAPGKNVTIGPEELGYINKSSQIIFLSPPSVTPLIPTSTPTPTPTINPTATPTPIQTLTITPILPTATPTRILTPTSSPSPTPMATTIQLTIGLDGIGNTGDNTNRIDTSAANPNPKRPKRDAEIEIFDVRNVKVDNYNGEIEYDPVTGFFTGGVKLYYIPSGDYIAKIKSTGYLTKTLPGIIHIVPGQKYTAPNMNLIAGDINGDNILNLSDYNILNDCIFSPAATHGTVCDQNPNYLINSDITDNGIKDIFDYNLFTRELTDRYGD